MAPTGLSWKPNSALSSWGFSFRRTASTQAGSAGNAYEQHALACPLTSTAAPTNIFTSLCPSFARDASASPPPAPLRTCQRA
eukprot:CAMPEP_0198242950 /NCGR_PEP_ID=MMETSP1446-20131203/22872_1 /TAXON_ID=1461542 ORGANISM="Unidentified sp, Strain CCMP2111" /NCGR_SAMPLE_ID=MMETSP1446 /ASSEMBLY_ACC=CAM_ASM_001112 /LENGTH=81 /DNA_ID=CAMNT_0043926629 /DNA_START=262 /DNA_END=507 /DNA_ORIENTATION=+